MVFTRGFCKMGFDLTKNIFTSQYPIYTASIQGLGLYADVVLQSFVLPLYLPRRLQSSSHNGYPYKALLNNNDQGEGTERLVKKLRT